MPTEDLSHTVSALWDLLNDHAEAWEDGPTWEVADLISLGNRNSLMRFCTDRGMTPVELWDAVVARTSYRWAYFNIQGLLEVVDLG